MNPGFGRKIDEQFRLLVDKISDGVIVLDDDGAVRFVNPAAEELLGRSAEQLLGQQIGLPVLNADFAEVDLVRRDGNTAVAELRIVQTDWDGERAYLLSLRDVTLRHQAAAEKARYQAELTNSEQTLRYQKKILELILDSMTDGVVVYERSGKLVLVNAVAERLLGCAPAELALEAWPEQFGLFHTDRKTLILPHESPALRACCGPSSEIEIFVRNPSNPAGRAVTYVGTPIMYGDDHIYGVMVVLRDVTDRKQAEEILLRTEKLATVGRMAATIAHEINNPLSATMNLIYMALHDKSLSDSVRAYLRSTDQELQRIAHITRQTLGFYRENSQFTAVQLPEVADDILSLFGPKLSHQSVQIKRKHSGSAAVRGIQGELRQIISNLVANSIDAVSTNGTLHIRTTGPVSLPEHPPMVRLTVADTGSGIHPDNLRRIFEPFFTTKQSVGTGLGLWVTSELVKKHSGTIRARSRVGKGTVVSIWLPLERRTAV